MALVLKDRVKETSVSTGTGAITLDGATGAYQPFSIIGNGNQTYYAIAGQTTNEWEVGIGTYTSSTDTLSRDTILSSSNSNTIVTFSAGTKDVFITYPSEKAIYEEPNGETLINAGPITVIGAGVTSIPSLPAELGKFIGDVDSFAQIYTLNQNDGSTASADFVAYNDLTTDGYTYFTDMGISSSNYTSIDYPLFTPNSGYVFHQGGDFYLGNQTTNKDVVIFSGGVDVTDVVATFSGTDRSTTLEADLNVGGALDVTGAATFGSTVLLDANPTLALQAATKQYVDNAVTAGVHIHEPVRVVSTSNLTATYAQGGTTFNITTITSTTTVTTSVNHGLSVNDQIWLTTTAGNGLSTNTAYFVYSTPALNQLTLSLTFGGAQITGLTNATGLTYATRANSGVGATLTNSGTQVALSIDGVLLSSTNRVLLEGQTNAEENGVYTVTTVGSGSTNWVLTRSTDSNTVNPSDPNGLGTGDYFFVQEGLTGTGDSYVLTTEPNTMIIGYTDLTYTQFSGAITYVGGTNIDVTGQTISLTGTVAATNGGTGTSTVTTGDLLYGSATNTWSKLPVGSAYRSLVVNSSGTQVEWNAVALNQTNAVSGSLGATNGGTGQSAYTLGDTLYSSATNTIAKLSGNTSTTKQYLSQTGTGSASAAPSWATISAADIGAGTLPAVRGGTGQSSYAIGDLLYADTTTSLAKLADVATGNALISGGVSTAPAWGKIGLTTHVSGTLGIANGGTNSTSTPTAGGVAYGTGTAYAVNSAGTSGQVLTSAGAGAPTWSTLFGIPSGGIIIWSGSAAAIPSGWVLCNGLNSTPDLRDRFVVGAGSTYAVGATGGSANAVLVSHTHTASSAFTGTALGTHNHTASFTGSALGTHTHTASTSTTNTAVSAGTPAGSVSTSSSFTGSALGTHSHTATSSVTDPGHFHDLPGNTSSGSIRQTQIGVNATSVLATSASKTTGITVGTTVDAASAGTPAGSVSSSSSFTGSALGVHNHAASSSTTVDAASAGTPAGSVTNVAASAGTPAGSVSTSNSTEGVSATNANLPPYYALCYIMKT